MTKKDKKYPYLVLKDNGTYSIYVSEGIKLNFTNGWAIGDYIEKQNQFYISAGSFDQNLFKKV